MMVMFSRNIQRFVNYLTGLINLLVPGKPSNCHSRGWYFAFQISHFRFRNSDFAFQISPFRYHISDFAFQISPFRFRLSDIAFRI